MEHKGSLPSLQELSACTYPEPDQCSPTHPILTLSTYVPASLVVSVPLAFLPVTYVRSSFYSTFLIFSNQEVLVRTYIFSFVTKNRPCGLVVRVPVYRSRDPGFDSRRYHIFLK
jgi:hypothetical protein